MLISSSMTWYVFFISNLTNTQCFANDRFQLPRMNRYPAINLVLVCNNARIHRSPRVQQLCDEAGVLLMYLPPYCPELNPIELCFAAMKTHLRRTQVLTYTLDPAWEVRSTFTKVVTAQMLYRLYSHCRYSVPPHGS